MPADGGIDAGLLLFEDSDIRKANFLVRIPDRVSSALASRGAEDALDARID